MNKIIDFFQKKFRYIKIRDDEPRPRDKKRREHTMKNIGHALTVIGTTISAMMLVLVIMICIVAIVVVAYVLDFADSGFDMNLRNAEKMYTTFIYARDAEGQEVEVKRLFDERNRIWVDYEDISPNILKAVVATEDKRFSTHKGVDWRRTVFALAMDIVSSDESNVRQGGSTITQQLIKNITEDDEQTWERKLREIFRALEIEKKYTKEQIIESYLNNIGWGGMNYGVGAACEAYFGKQASEVTIAEAAILAGMIRNPNIRSPYTDLANCKASQEYALDNMYEQGYISTAEYEAAYKEKVQFKNTVIGDAFGYIDPRSLKNDEDEENPDEDAPDDDTYEAYRWDEYEVTQNWYVDAAINQVVSDYAELKGISETSARKEIYNGGYKIYINEDIEMQNKLEEVYKDPYLVVTSYNKNAPANELVQAAFVVMDYSGTVKAIAGGLGDKPGINCFNRATMAVRSPGSTMKPISVYATAVQNNLITYSTMIPNAQIWIIGDYGEKTTWPFNFGGLRGDGTPTLAWSAVRQSLNTVAARVAQMLTPQVCYNQLTQNLGITTMTESDIALSPVSLGALTEGIKLVELAAAYQMFGNGGIYYRPMLYNRVLDVRDNVILEQNYIGNQAIDPDAAWITNRMLRTVVTNPGTGAATAQLPNIEVVGKTGTSNDSKNFTFVGLTPEYVGAYWVGYEGGQEFGRDLPDYHRYTATVWHDTMIKLVDTSQSSKFVPESTVLERRYCLDTGLLASSKCTNTDIGYYRQNNIPNMCSGDHEAEIEKIKDHWADIDAANLAALG